MVTLKNSKRDIAKHALPIFVPLFLCMLAGIFFLYNNSSKTHQKLFEESGKDTLEQITKNLSLTIENIKHDLLEESSHLSTHLDNFDLEREKGKVSHEFIAMLKHHPNYESVIFIDTEGIEKVGAESSNGAYVILPEGKLQKRVDSEYFVKSMALEGEHAFLSSFDFQQIYSDEKASEYLPTMYFSKPVFNSQKQKQGVFVLKYSGAKLLKRFRAVTKTIGDIALFNQDQLLLAKNESTSKAISWDDENITKFWPQIKQTDSGMLCEMDNCFAFNTISLLSREDLLTSDNRLVQQPANINNNSLKLIYFLGGHAEQAAPPSRNPFITIFATFTVLLGLCSWLIGTIRCQRKQELNFIRLDNVRLENEVKEQTIELIHKVKELEQKEKKFRTLVESMNDALVIVNKDGVILETNSATSVHLGYSREELVGMNVRDIDTEGYDGQVEDRIDKIYKLGLYMFETMHRRKDGTTTPVEINCRQLDYNGQNVHLSVWRDINERKRIEKLMLDYQDKLESAAQTRTLQLHEMQDKLIHSEKLAAIGRLSASIAHEFNNPLYGIQNVLEGIRNNCQLKDDYQGLVDLSLAECSRVKMLIQNLQDFNRPSPGKKENADIHALINPILTMSKKRCKVNRIDIKKEYNDSLPMVCCVVDQIKQVLLNLFNNAVDAMEDEGGVLTITTNIIGEHIAVHIQDTGKGINPDNLKNIFEPFFTTKSSVKGTGLGLSVSHGIIHNNNGKIEVGSKLGKGSTFTVLLPAKP